MKRVEPEVRFVHLHSIPCCQCCDPFLQSEPFQWHARDMDQVYLSLANAIAVNGVNAVWDSSFFSTLILPATRILRISMWKEEPIV
jgi:hypothetical protein